MSRANERWICEVIQSVTQQMPVQHLLHMELCVRTSESRGPDDGLLNVRLKMCKMYMFFHGAIFRINKIVYSECSVSHYTL